MSTLLVLSGGAIVGALAASRFADRLGPRPVVAICFLIGGVFISLMTLELPIRLAFVAVIGLGTTGTSLLIYGLVANQFPTKMRGAAVAWAAGFGRLGGVSGHDGSRPDADDLRHCLGSARRYARPRTRSSDWTPSADVVAHRWCWPDGSAKGSQSSVIPRYIDKVRYRCNA